MNLLFSTVVKRLYSKFIDCVYFATKLLVSRKLASCSIVFRFRVPVSLLQIVSESSVKVFWRRFNIDFKLLLRITIWIYFLSALLSVEKESKTHNLLIDLGSIQDQMLLPLFCPHSHPPDLPLSTSVTKEHCADFVLDNYIKCNTMGNLPVQKQLQECKVTSTW